MSHITTRTSIGIIAAVLMIASPASAQSQADAGAIEALLAQLKALQAQIAQIKGESVGTSMPSMSDGVEIVSRLRIGSESDEVTTLQKLLAGDPSLYPEGKITGYFGALTAEAVKRFQRMHGLEAVGEVGPLTRAKIKEWRMSLKGTVSTDAGMEALPRPTMPAPMPATPVNPGNVDSIIDAILGDITGEDIAEDASIDALPDVDVSLPQ